MGERKFLSKIFLIVTFLTVIVIAGCSSSDDKTASEGNGGSGKVTLDVFQYKVEFKEQFENLIAKYQEENPDVVINVQTVGGGNSYASAVKSQFSSGNEYFQRWWSNRSRRIS